MDSTRIWHLMARSLNGECTPEEMDEFFQLLGQNESLQQQYELLSRIWKDKDRHTEDNNVTSSIERIIRKAEDANTETNVYSIKRRSRRRILLAAAIIVVLLAAGGWLWLANSNTARGSEALMEEAIIAKNGSRSRSLLPDGTTVWLNAGSKLSYENDFTGATREVRLEGEAFFDVVRNPSRPFIVHTAGIDIKVLGTAFNVKSYPEDKNVETTLYRGLVNVSREGENKRATIELKPNQKLILSKQTPQELKLQAEETGTPSLPPAEFIITGVDSTKKENERYETAWLYSRLEFRGDSFEELAHKLERWYNVTIVFADEKVKRLHLNGSFENETVEQAFAALKEGFPITYKINNNEISVGSSQ